MAYVIMNNDAAGLAKEAAAFAADARNTRATVVVALVNKAASITGNVATATVDIAFGVLLRRAAGIDTDKIGAGRNGLLKNYHSTMSAIEKDGYGLSSQAEWLPVLRAAGKFSTYGQSKTKALTALIDLGLIAKQEKACAKEGAKEGDKEGAKEGAEEGAISTALSDADRAGNIAAELIGQMSPEVFDLLATAVAQRMTADTAAQQRRDAAAAERKAAADIAAAAKAAQEKADADAAHIAELRRKADAADLTAVAADQAAKQPDATAVTKKRAARLLKKAQEAGSAYLAAAASAAHQAA